MDSKLETAMATMQKDLKALTFHYIACLVIIVVMLILAFAMGNVVATPYLCIAMLAIVFIYRFIFVRRKRIDFTNDFNHHRAILGFEGMGAEDVTHIRKAGIDLEELDKARLIPVSATIKNVMRVEHITCHYNDYNVEMCDCSFLVTYKKGGKNQGVGVPGAWTMIDLGFDSGCDWRLLEKSAVPEMARRDYFHSLNDMEKVELGVEWFDEKYYFYRPTNSKQKPSANLLRQLQILQDFTPGKICIALVDNKLHVFIKGRILARTVNFAKPITNAMCTQCPLPELEHIGRMAKVIRPYHSEEEATEAAASVVTETEASTETE